MMEGALMLVIGVLFWGGLVWGAFALSGNLTWDDLPLAYKFVCAMILGAVLWLVGGLLSSASAADCVYEGKAYSPGAVVCVPTN
jgi:hypothetical protein